MPIIAWPPQLIAIGAPDSIADIIMRARSIIVGIDAASIAVMRQVISPSPSSIDIRQVIIGIMPMFIGIMPMFIGITPFIVGIMPMFVGIMPFIMGIMPFIMGIMPFIMGIMPFIMGVMPFIMGIIMPFIMGIIMPFIMGIIMPMFIGIVPLIGRSASRFVLDIALTFIGIMVRSPPTLISPCGANRKPRGQAVGGFLRRSGPAFVRVEGGARPRRARARRSGARAQPLTFFHDGRSDTRPHHAATFFREVIWSPAPIANR
jgi:hypothetical protein